MIYGDDQFKPDVGKQVADEMLKKHQVNFVSGIIWSHVMLAVAPTVTSAGTLMIGTDSPAYDPWFRKNNPSNGQGFESAVAYAVADQLGFTQDEVEWVKVPFNTSYKPGAKDFDFDINQISITPKRQKAVDFSDRYYTVNQAVVALNDSPIATATTLAELQAAKLGAQVGTTSLDFITDVVQPADKPFVYNDTNDANDHHLRKTETPHYRLRTPI